MPFAVSRWRGWQSFGARIGLRRDLAVYECSLLANFGRTSEQGMGGIGAREVPFPIERKLRRS